MGRKKTLPRTPEGLYVCPYCAVGAHKSRDTLNLHKKQYLAAVAKKPEAATYPRRDISKLTKAEKDALAREIRGEKEYDPTEGMTPEQKAEYKRRHMTAGIEPSDIGKILELEMEPIDKPKDETKEKIPKEKNSCGGCGAEFNGKPETCPVCGAELTWS